VPRCENAIASDTCRLREFHEITAPARADPGVQGRPSIARNEAAFIDISIALIASRDIDQYLYDLYLHGKRINIRMRL